MYVKVLCWSGGEGGSEGLKNPLDTNFLKYTISKKYLRNYHEINIFHGFQTFTSSKPGRLGKAQKRAKLA